MLSFSCSTTEFSEAASKNVSDILAKGFAQLKLDVADTTDLVL